MFFLLLMYLIVYIKCAVRLVLKNIMFCLHRFIVSFTVLYTIKNSVLQLAVFVGQALMLASIALQLKC